MCYSRCWHTVVSRANTPDRGQTRSLDVSSTRRVCVPRRVHPNEYTAKIVWDPIPMAPDAVPCVLPWRIPTCASRGYSPKRVAFGAIHVPSLSSSVRMWERYCDGQRTMEAIPMTNASLVVVLLRQSFSMDWLLPMLLNVLFLDDCTGSDIAVLTFEDFDFLTPKGYGEVCQRYRAVSFQLSLLHLQLLLSQQKEE